MFTPHDSSHLTLQHLLTCELDGQEMRTVDDCVAKLKRLDTKGRLWAQEMIMEIQGGYLLLSDIETKVSSCFGCYILQMNPVTGSVFTIQRFIKMTSWQN